MSYATKAGSRANAKRYYQRHQERLKTAVFVRTLRVRYNISLEQYQQLFKDQCGLCAICGLPSSKVLHVDHNHETGKVRGLLCGHCNFGLGHFKESRSSMRKAIEYVEKHNG